MIDAATLARRVAEDLLGWEIVEPQAGTCLRRVSHHGTFAAALAWVNQVAAIAEQHQHHPDIAISWDAVTLELRSHSAGGVTEADLLLASGIDAAAPAETH